MELNLVLNQIDFKFFVKMIETKGFRNPKNWSQDQIKGSINFFKKRWKIAIYFEIKNWTTMIWTFATYKFLKIHDLKKTPKYSASNISNIIFENHKIQF